MTSKYIEVEKEVEKENNQMSLQLPNSQSQNNNNDEDKDENINKNNNINNNENYNKNKNRIKEILPVPFKKIRVAFMSLFFGIFEPHGMLLDGIMKNIPRTQFTVIALPIARSDGKPLSPSIIESCDEIIETTLHHGSTYQLISSLDIDILVFADTMSEPVTHFLAHTRLAKIQVSTNVTYTRVYVQTNTYAHARIHTCMHTLMH